MIAVFAALILGIMPWCGIGVAGCMGYKKIVMKRLERCKKAREALGEDIGLAYYGLTYGFAKTEGGYGRVTWTLPVKGDKARGTYRFYLERHSGPWQLLNAQLETGKKIINIRNCRYVKKEEDEE